MWVQILLVATGGAAGALCRYGASLLAAHLFGTRYAWGTLFVNLVGCLLVGFVFALASQRDVLSISGRLWVMTGFLGAMTTFSTFALESAQLVRGAEYDVALLNLVVHNAGGIALVFVGIYLGNRV